jgi:hypothetical protein
MHELVLVFAIIAATTVVAIGCVLACRHFLKLRREQAPEVVYGREELGVEVASSEPERQLAA